MAPVKEDAVIRWPPKVAQHETDATDFSGVLINISLLKKKEKQMKQNIVSPSGTNILERPTTRYEHLRNLTWRPTRPTRSETTRDLGGSVKTSVLNEIPVKK